MISFVAEWTTEEDKEGALPTMVEGVAIMTEEEEAAILTEEEGVAKVVLSRTTKP